MRDCSVALILYGFSYETRDAIEGTLRWRSSFLDIEKSLIHFFSPVYQKLLFREKKRAFDAVARKKKAVAFQIRIM